MKSECVKFLLDCYLNAEQQYDEIDGCAQEGEKFVHLQKDLHCITGGYNPENSELQAESGVIVTSNGNLNSEQELLIKQIASELKKFSYMFEKTRQSKKLGIQFKKTSIFVPISDRKVEVQIVQADDQTESAKLKWKTIDGTAKSGLNFLGCEGEISFQETDKQKSVEIQLLDLGEDEEAHFEVELISLTNSKNEPAKKVNVFITNYNLQPDEAQTVKNILHQDPSVATVANSLNKCTTAHTFQTALQYLCGSTNSIPIQLTLACELAKLTISKISKDSLYNIVSNYFRNLPELEEIAPSFY